MKGIFRICMILALGVAALQTTLSAQDNHTIVGVWALDVTVVSCTGSGGKPAQYFAGFMSYLGYGYLDTWHGIGTLLLLPVFVAGIVRSRVLIDGPLDWRSVLALVVAAVIAAIGAGLAFQSARRAEVSVGGHTLNEVARVATGHQRAERVAFADRGRMLAVTCSLSKGWMKVPSTPG